MIALVKTYVMIDLVKALKLKNSILDQFLVMQIKLRAEEALSVTNYFVH